MPLSHYMTHVSLLGPRTCVIMAFKIWKYVACENGTGITYNLYGSTSLHAKALNWLRWNLCYIIYSWPAELIIISDRMTKCLHCFIVAHHVHDWILACISTLYYCPVLWRAINSHRHHECMDNWHVTHNTIIAYENINLQLWGHVPHTFELLQLITRNFNYVGGILDI